MVTEEPFNAARFIEFLKRLIAGRYKPVFLILEGHPAHIAKKLKEFVKEHCELIELNYLPGYFPELNPDEHGWNHVGMGVRRVSRCGRDQKHTKLNNADPPRRLFAVRPGGALLLSEPAP